MSVVELVPTFDPETYKAPFPYMGGKSRVAAEVWARFGDVPNYVEPFFGSGAVLFKRPAEHDWAHRIETVNDADGMVANVWRALQSAPEEVARYADWPVNENDLHARHVWLKGQREDLTRRLEGDPDWYDAKVAGWWVWATCLWIGGPLFADGPWVVIDGELVRMPRERGVKRKRPHLGDAGRGIERKLPHLGDAGRGIERKLPHLCDAGVGIHRKRPHLGDAGRGECEQWSEHLRTYMMQLAARLRRVRVCCGDWARVMGTAPTLHVGNPTGIFLDPPYSQKERDPRCYRMDRLGLAEECREWCLEHGDDPRLRIALCGYAGEGHEPLEAAGWSVLAWKTHGGYSNQRKTGTNDNKYRERIWFSPHCLSAEAETPHQPQLQEVVIPFDAR